MRISGKSDRYAGAPGGAANAIGREIRRQPANGVVVKSGPMPQRAVALSNIDIAIDIAGVSFTYPTGVQAIRDLTLKLERGRRVGIVGPSGCGKSTLLALIAGLRTPTSGAVDVTCSHPTRHPIAMVFQKDTLLPWLTVRKNVKLYHKFHRDSARNADDFVQQLLTMAGLDDFQNAYPYQLSGGMRRRAAFLSAVAARPEILLMDEPFSSIDEPSRVAIHQEVYQIIGVLGTTTILVTHDLAEAISLCDEVIILTARPATTFTQRLVPFARERDMLALRKTREFLDLYGTLWNDLTIQISAGRSKS